MSERKWNGKLHRPARSGESMKTGTVEWERDRRHRKMRREVIRELIAEQERNGTIKPQPKMLSYSGPHWAILRAIARLFSGKS